MGSDRATAAEDPSEPGRPPTGPLPPVDHRHDLAPWNTAYRVFTAWTADGTRQRIHDLLRDQVRERDGRDPQPSAAVLDSQSAKSSEGGEEIGYDAGKHVRGRKRHLLVDTLGLLLVGIVHSASVHDRAGARRVLTGVRRRIPLLGLVWVDGGYVNSVDAGLVSWAHERENLEVVAVPRNAVERLPGATPPVLRGPRGGMRR